MKGLITYTLTLLLALSACKLQTTKSAFQQLERKSVPAEQTKETTSSFMDTVIVLLPVINHLNAPNKQITEKQAETLLYQHFKRKGVMPRTELNHLDVSSNEILSVSYDTIYKFNNNKLSGAVISYWLGPADLNGHCFQPSKAIILPTKKGYTISHENFIPNKFAIDSSNGSSLFGCDYECGGRGVLRKLKITLQ